MSTNVETTHDPEEFQWVTKTGKVIKLSELTKEELAQVACECMVVIENLEGRAQAQLNVCDAWRNGRKIDDVSSSGQ